MGVLRFDKPKKARSTEEHNKKYVADSAPLGVYIPNMSDADAYTWRAKHIRGANERVEIRRSLYQAQMVIIIAKNDGDPKITISSNGKMNFSLNLFIEMRNAINEAFELLGLEIPAEVPSMDGINGWEG